ncbi:hypothetical protein D3C87_741920 [compost metagenome]
MSKNRFFVKGAAFVSILFLYQNCSNTFTTGANSQAESASRFPSQSLEQPALDSQSILNSLQPDAKIYVSTSGNDLSSGKIEAPLRTLEEAQKRVRLAKQKTASSIGVILRGGTYSLTQPLRFGVEDGGGDNQKIYYMSYPGEKAILSGGTPVMSWIATGVRGIYLTETPLKFRQLYLKSSDTIGTRPQRARWPTEYHPANLPAYKPELQVLSYQHQLGTCANSTADNGILSSLKLKAAPLDGLSPVAFAGSELVILKAHTQTRLQMSVVSSNGTEITVVPDQSGASLEGCNNFFGAARAFRAYFENSLDFVRNRQDWFLNRGAQTLYYIPKSPEQLAPGQVIMPRLEELLIIAGTDANPVRSLVFSGLEFRHTTWNLPSSDGYFGGQAGHGNFCKSPEGCQVKASIQVKNADRPIFFQNTFAQIGGTALKIGTGVSSALILENLFEQISGTGLELGGVSSDVYTNQKESRGAYIFGNLFQDIGLDYDGVGIFVGYAPDTVIASNKIRYVGYTGINVGVANAKNLSQNVLVKQNEISEFMLTYDDGGALYTYEGRGVSFIENYVHDGYSDRGLRAQAPFMHMGIYLDGFSNHITCERNVIANLAEGLFLQTAKGAEANNSVVAPLLLKDVDVRITTESAVMEVAGRTNNIIEIQNPSNSSVYSSVISFAGLPKSSSAQWSRQLDRAPKGFFRVRNKEALYFSDGEQFCGYNEFSVYQNASGNLSTRLIPELETEPKTQPNAGVCR